MVFSQPYSEVYTVHTHFSYFLVILTWTIFIFSNFRSSKLLHNGWTAIFIWCQKKGAQLPDSSFWKRAKVGNKHKSRRT